MRDLAARGYTREGKRLLDAEQCQEVVDHLIRECRSAGCPLDLRLLDNSYMDHLQCDGDQSACHWRDLVASRVREASHHFGCEVSGLAPEERRARRRQVLRQILQQTDEPSEQLRRSCEETGASRADFFRQKGNVLSG